VLDTKLEHTQKVKIELGGDASFGAAEDDGTFPIQNIN
jgi:hypothetical protein